MASWDIEKLKLEALKPDLIKREARLLAEKRARERQVLVEEIEGKRTRIHRVSLRQQQEGGYSA